MSKPKKPDINQMLLIAHRDGVKQAIETAARTNTSLVVYENGRLKSIKPNFKYVRVPIKTPTKSRAVRTPASRRKK